jgi:hypothetical protein
MAAASAAESKVEVLVEEVHASNASTAVDPPLVPMKESFAKAGLNYTSFRRLSRQRLTLEQGKGHELKLANGSSSQLTLKDLRHNNAHVEVSLPPVKTTYTLGREGSVFIQAGPHNGGMLILVLSPVPAS